MASPIITKAIYEGGKWYSAVVILPRRAALEVQPFAGTPGDAGIKPVQGQHYARIKPMGGAQDAISGFERFISKDNVFVKQVGR